MNAIIGRNKREKYSSQWWVIGSASGQISDFHFTKSKQIKNQLLARPLCTGQPCWQILGEQGWVDLSPSLAHRTALQCIFANSIINSFYVHLNVQLSNLWRKPNSTSIGFDTATKTGKTRMSLKSCGVSFDPFWWAVFMPKPMLTKFPIHYILETCKGSVMGLQNHTDFESEYFVLKYFKVGG